MLTIDSLIENPRPVQANFRLSFRCLQEFVHVMWQIPAYHAEASQKVFPIYSTELSDINPDRSGGKSFFPGSNPFFRHVSFLQYFLVKEEGRVLGRIACYIDQTYKERDIEGDIGWIGLFECVENEEAALLLIDTALNTLKKQGAVKIIGPAKYNANGEVGLTIGGFQHRPMFMEPYHPPYYQSYFDQRGQKENDWFAFGLREEGMVAFDQRVNAIRKNGKKIETLLEEEGIKIRHIRMDRIKQDTSKIKAVYNTAWDTKEHPQFEKMTHLEFDALVKALKLIVIDKLVLLVEDFSKPGQPIVGMSVSIPDIHESIAELDAQRGTIIPDYSWLSLGKMLVRDMQILRLTKSKIRNQRFRSARVMILGTLVKKIGLDALLYLKTYEIAKNRGIVIGSGSQIADTNLEMKNPLMKFGRVTLTWRVYRFL